MTKYWWGAAALGVILTVACTDAGRENNEHFAPGASAQVVPGPVANEFATIDGRDTEGTTSSPEHTSAAPASPTGSGGSRRPTPAGGPMSARTSGPRESSFNEATARSSSSNAAAPVASAPVWREITLPAGTSLQLELQTALSSRTAHVETPVRARFRSPVVVNGYTVIPAGAIASGTVTDVDRPGRVKGRARLAFRFTDVQVNGSREELTTNPIAFVGERSKGEDATKIGGGALGGAIIGGILGGGDGAAKGAAIGGAAGTGAVLATRGKDVTVAAGTDLTATLASPTDFRVSTR